jgi:hypothetical protein
MRTRSRSDQRALFGDARRRRIAATAGGRGDTDEQSCSCSST